MQPCPAALVSAAPYTNYAPFARFAIFPPFAVVRPPVAASPLRRAARAGRRHRNVCRSALLPPPTADARAPLP